MGSAASKAPGLKAGGARRDLSPDHLIVYLSTRCNLRCAYCFARQKRSGTLTAAAFERGLGQFAALKGGNKRITFLGGEPLLRPGLLRQAVRAIRRLMPAGTPVRVFTNATLLTPALLRFFEAKAVRLVVSLDGKRESNDLHRKFSASGASVFKTALARLGPAVSGASVSMVVTPGTAAALPENIAALREAGFESIAWVPDLTTEWDGPALAAMKTAVRKVGADYFRDLRAGRRLYEIANIYEFLDSAPEKARTLPCSSVMLFPDGELYPCDKLLGAPAGALKSFRLKSGRGFAASRRNFFAAAGKEGRVSSRRGCPVGAWAHFKYVRGAEEGKLRRILASHAALNAVVDGFYRQLAACGRAYPAFRERYSL